MRRHTASFCQLDVEDIETEFFEFVNNEVEEEGKHWFVEEGCQGEAHSIVVNCENNDV